MRIKLSLFYQYLFFYSLLLILPLLLLGGMFYAHISMTLEKKVIESNQISMERIEEYYDLKLKEMMNIAVHISSNYAFSSNNINNPYNVNTAFQSLNYSGANEFFYDILFYPRGSKYIYSSEYGSFRLEDYHKMNRYEDGSSGQFTTELNVISEPLWKPTQNVQLSNHNEALVTYMIPIPVNSPSPYATLVFQIRETTIQNLFRSVVSYPDSYATLLGPSGQIMIDAVGSSTKFMLHKSEIPSWVENTTNLIELEGERYHIAMNRSGTTGWTYLAVIPENELLQEISKLRNQFLFVIALILIIGSSLIYVAMHMNYQPIRQLIRTVERKWGTAIEDHSGINKVLVAIDHAESLGLQWRQQAEHSRPALQRQLLTDILKGRMGAWEELAYKGNEAGIVIPEKLHCSVMMMEIDSTYLALGDTVKVINGWIEMMPPGVTAYYMEVVESEQWVWLMFEPTGQLLSNESWQQMHESLLSRCGQGITIGAGKPYEDIQDVRKSYIEASLALEYQLIKGKDQWISFIETGTDNRHIDWYPKPQLDQLYAAIKRAHRDEAKSIVIGLSALIREKGTNLFMVRYLCLEMLNAIMRALIDSELDDQLHFVPDMFSVTECYRMEELQLIVVQAAETACEQVKQSQTNEEDIVTQVKRYIGRHGCDSNFSVRDLAEHFSVSYAYLSSDFKEKTRLTLSEYVHRVRIKQAKYLLKTTERQLQDIVVEIGYQDVSSFIRKFKLSENMTPGEYRKLHQ